MPLLKNWLILLLFWCPALSEAQTPQLVVPLGHAGYISDILFSPDNNLVITTASGEENLVKVWEASSGKLLQTLNAHTDDVTSVSMSRDGKYILTTGHDQFANIWETVSGKLVKAVYHPFNNWIEKGFFSPDGKQVLLVSAEVMELYDLGAGKTSRVFLDSSLLKTAQFYRSSIIDADLSADGKYIVTTHRDSLIKIWETSSGRLLYRTRNPDEAFIFCRFTASGKEVVVSSASNDAWVIETTTGKTRHLLKGHTDRAFSICPSPDGKEVLTGSFDKTARLWDIRSGKLLQTFSGSAGWILTVQFSPDGKHVLTGSLDGMIRLWDKQSGKMLKEITKAGIDISKLSEKETEELYLFMKAAFSPDGTRIAAASVSGKAVVTDVSSGKEIARLEGISSLVINPVYHPAGRLLAAIHVSPDEKEKSKTMIWDMQTGKLPYNLSGYEGMVTELQFSPDSNYIAGACSDSAARIWTVNDGRLLYTFRGHTDPVYKIYFTPDSKYLLTHSFNSTGKIWNLESGESTGLIRHPNYEKNKYGIYRVRVSGSGKYFVTTYYDDYRTDVMETATGKTVASLEVKRDSLKNVLPDPLDRFIAYTQRNEICLQDLRTGAVKRIPSGRAKDINAMSWSHDGRLLVTSTPDSTVQLWSVGTSLEELATGKLVQQFKNVNASASELLFSPDNKYFILRGFDSTIRVRETAGNRLLHTFKETSLGFYTSRFTADGKYLVTQSFDNRLKVWDMQTGTCITDIPVRYLDAYILHPRLPELLVDNKFSLDNYRFGDSAPRLRIFTTGPEDFLVMDSNGRYDGTTAARKSLYLVCNNEIVELEQVKDQLWVPDLAERITKGETIGSKSIAELNICDFSPKLETLKPDGNAFRFKVIPRRGGLGETVLYINGIEARRYQPNQLKKTGKDYELIVRREELAGLFVAGKENRVTAKAYTAGNTVSSRGAIVRSNEEQKKAVSPNLYAVMIGVSDYKGDELDLQYAAKDATDISGALAAAARNLLNTDGKEHVFLYNLTTARDRYLLPEKKSIQKTLGEIAAKATANDVLLIFFAGHGIMAGEGDKKQFYFLTADASTLATTDAVKEVGISTAELSDWMKPQLLKAQKRILIFDACNSGQAIKDFVKLGADDQQYLAARNDDKSRLVKAIDKLNEKSGLFILSASASDQSAYEMGRYAQGLLTYSLLKAIKQQPDILEDGKYLDVSRWFNAAEKTVTEIARETGARQEPQIVSTTNFNIGLVDEEVVAGIVLPQEKPLFAASNFQNSDEAIADDDLELSKLINLRLQDLATRGADSKIVYVTATNAPDAWTLSGRYTVKDNTVILQVNLKQHKTIKTRFEISGAGDKLAELAARVAEKAAALVK